MALRECCDAFGTANGVKLYRITVEEITERTGVGIETAQSLRGKKRLDRFIARGTTPPKAKAGTETP